MAEPKGIYFGGGNRGLASILDSNADEIGRYVGTERQRKLQDEVRAKQEQDKRAEQLKNFDSWRYYSPALQEQYNAIAEDLKNGKIDNFELKSRLNDYATQAQASMQLKTEYDDAAKDFEKNKKVLGGAASEWYLNSYHANPTVDNLKKISASPLNRYGFLDEKGGSKYVNPTEAFRDVVENSLGGWVENEIAQAGKGKVVARGLMEFAESNDITKIRSFTEVDPKTGKIKVKDIDKLIDSGVLDLFEQDPYTKRVLEDRTDQVIGDQEVDPEERQRVKTAVLRDILQPYGSTGVVKSTDGKSFRNYSVPSASGGGGGGKDDAEAKRIYDVFKSRSVGTGADVGEEKVYTQQMVTKYGLPKDFVGKKYIESKALEGYKNEGGDKLGRIVFREGDKRFDGVARVEVITKDENGVEKKQWRSLTMNELENFLPRGVYNKVEELARSEGRLDQYGNFVYDTEDDINNY